MVLTGCASAVGISACSTAQHPFVPQVLPACGLQDSRNEEQNHYPKLNPNTMCPPLTLGGNHGPGHFYLAENRTFLLCVDTKCRSPETVSIAKTSVAISNTRLATANSSA